MIDLSSTNGSYLNGERMEAGVFYRLKEGDSLRFAYGHREYRLLQQR
ncbi:MAG: FHA domain-containing protein [Promethearchaeia archaeon]